MKQEDWKDNEGSVREEKLEPELIVERSPVLAWLDNFWYHYKWHVIVGAFFVAVFIIAMAQMISRPKYDTAFLTAGTYRMNTEERADFEELLDDILPTDYDGNGEKNVNLIIYQIYSEAEYNEEVSIAEANSEQFAINGKYNSDEFNNFSQFTMTGECSVYLLSEYLFDTLRTGHRLRPVSDLYGEGELPAGLTEDGYGVRISDTDFYKYNPAAQALPDDMILCILEPTVWGGSSDSEKYARSEALFMAIADYQVKE